MCDCTRPSAIGGFCGSPSADGSSGVEQRGGERNFHWQFVGDGLGGYDKAVDFDFVGSGNGSYQFREDPPPSRCLSRRSHLAVLGALLGVGAIAWWSAYTGRAPGAPSLDASAAPVYDCLSADDMMPMKGEYCCARYQRFCDFGAPQAGPIASYEAATPHEAFNCTDAPGNAASEWSVTQRGWCCQHDHVGCSQGTPGPPEGHPPVPAEAPAPPTPVAAPPAGPPAPVAGPAVAAPSFRVDCEEGYSNWRRGWSAAKQAYCCANEHKGCLSLRRV